MTYKGEYDSGTSYGVGDVVVFQDQGWFVMKKAAPAGTPCTNTLYWNRASYLVSIAAKLVYDAFTLLAAQVSAIPTAELPEEDGEYTFTATLSSGEATYSWEAEASDEL